LKEAIGDATDCDCTFEPLGVLMNIESMMWMNAS